MDKKLSIFDLSGKKCLVTGATGGIGQAIVNAMVVAGAVVCASGTNEEKLHSMASLGIATLMCNLADEVATSTLIERTCNVIGGLDVLVCNAGITRDRLALRMSMTDWNDVLDINLKSTFILNRDACRRMMSQRCGKIINMSSVVGVAGNAGQANYAAAKAGMIAMSKSLAKEFAGKGICINCIAPGFIATPMTEIIPEKNQEQILESIPMKRMGTPDEIAGVTVFLASDAANYITGQVIHVNGGMLMA